jgi:TonB family protein
MRKIFFFLTISFCFINFISAQEKVEKQYELKGVVKDKNFGVIAGLPLFFKSNNIETFVSTDLNGEFSIKLLPGNYEVTVKKNISETFAAFIKISGDELNPNYVEFNIETNPVCCGTVSEITYPEILNSVTPKYPAAARAVRALGEVSVNVKVDNQGKVTEAKAISGHPLLRQASVNSAKEFLFSSSEIKERELFLTFVFLLPFVERKNINRYSNPYRIEVVGETETIYN